MVNGKFSTPQLSLEYMERGLRTAISIAEPVEQPVVVTAATNEVCILATVLWTVTQFVYSHAVSSPGLIDWLRLSHQ